MQSNRHQYFVKNLLSWNTYQNSRQMPWKSETNPYKIWLSEIILQQTRVEQGLKYFEGFVKNFPTISHLAVANEEKVFKIWEGLGYYSRCRNLMLTAKYIHEELNAVFPTKYEDILALKGVGPYTAAAISSFAYNLPYAVLDGNVFRVLARYFGIHTAIDSTAGKKLFTDLANQLLDKKSPAIYNQAIMDFGAIICKPKNPLCGTCLLQKNCIAYSNNEINLLPIKEKKLLKRNRYFYYIIARYRNAYFVRKRSEKDIWQNLNEFILHESETLTNIEQFIKEEIPLILKKSSFSTLRVSALQRQQLSHQNIKGYFIEIQLTDSFKLNSYQLINVKELKHLAFPKFINSYLQETQILE